MKPSKPGESICFLAAMLLDADAVEDDVADFGLEEVEEGDGKGRYQN